MGTRTLPWNSDVFAFLFRLLLPSMVCVQGDKISVETSGMKVHGLVETLSATTSGKFLDVSGGEFPW